MNVLAYFVMGSYDLSHLWLVLSPTISSLDIFEGISPNGDQSNFWLCKVTFSLSGYALQQILHVRFCCDLIRTNCNYSCRCLFFRSSMVSFRMSMIISRLYVKCVSYVFSQLIHTLVAQGFGVHGTAAMHAWMLTV